jgi:predicted DsbA family dithiol-disulfide isomerase
MEYRMGGLLPDWRYNSGGISKPSDVAHHWDEVSHHYDMPIDGDVWLEDPLHSSYPPSIAFKAAALQDKSKAVAFLRVIREMVFLRKKNIARWEHLVTAAQQAGLNVKQFQLDYEGKGKELFNEDLALARELGVRGFPTLFFVDSLGRQERVYGTKPYGVYETALLKLQPDANKTSYDARWNNLFAKYPTLTSREFSELSGIGRNDSDKHLEQIYKEGYLQKAETKNGMLWMSKNSSREPII